ncbi:MAG: tryptophan synthase subunit alpha [Patescibacteria group bacterium]|nr:tryptophan synthase subunit alpha [Patescibacteria group bacterium]
MNANPIDAAIARARAKGNMGLMTHAVVGFPSLQATVALAETMDDAGADLIELQIPFSDPLADGPTIMGACEESLRRGTRVRDAFKVASILSRRIAAPLIFMAYYNTVFKHGVKEFCREAARAGISGIIVPDLPLEEDQSEHLREQADLNGIYFIRVIAPASTPGRLEKNAAVAKGFVYCSAWQGITGARADLPPGLAAYLKKVRRLFKVPVAVGFGISNPEHIEKLRRHADVAVVGSAIINLINQSGSKKFLPVVRRFIRDMKKQCSIFEGVSLSA